MGQWSEWCIPWAAIIQTRLGFNEAPAVLLNIWREIFVNEGMATAYLPRFRSLVAHRRHDLGEPKESHEVMRLDGTMGCATAPRHQIRKLKSWRWNSNFSSPFSSASRYSAVRNLPCMTA
ncbi:MAG: hypothetical protein GXP32_00690 [Kiritimatiellaeota bacterium]|nr:hypothetical protein [Kiritimatiellota bacterium]